MVTLRQAWVFWHVVAQVGLEEYRVDVSFLVHCIISIGSSVIYFYRWSVEPSDFLFFFFLFFFFNNLDFFNRDRRFHYQTSLLEEGDNWS